MENPINYQLHNGELCIMRNGVPIPVVQEKLEFNINEHPPFVNEEVIPI